MADLSYTVDVNTSPAQRNLDQLNKRLGVVATAFDKLKTAIGGLAIGTLTANAIKYADAIQDLSDATGIATNTIVGFQSAVKDSGGEVEGAQKSLLNFAETIQEAADGGRKAQLTFEKVGVTLQDLRTLSEEELLKKSVDGISKLGDATERLSTQTALFGKGAKGVNFQSVASGMGTASADAMRYASAISSAAAAQGSLDTNLRNLTQAILQVSQPLNDLVAKLNFTVEDFEKLIKIIGTAAGAYLLFTRGLSVVTTSMNSVMTTLRSGGTMFAWFIAQFKSIGNNFALFFKNLERAVINVGVALGIFSQGAGTTAGVLGSLAAMAANVMRVLLRFAGVAGIIYTVAEAFEFLEKKIFGTSYVSKGLELVAIGLEKITVAAGQLLNLPTNIIGKLLGIDNAVGLGDPLIALAKKAEEARKGLDSAAGAGRGGNDAITKQLQDRGEELRKQSEEVRKVEDAFAKQRKQIEMSAVGFSRQNEELIKGIQLETQLIGKTEEYSEIRRAQADIEKRAADQIQQLRDAKALLSADEQKLGVIYDQQIAKVEKQLAVDKERLTNAVQGLQTAKLLEEDRLRTIENVTKAIESQISRQQQLGDLMISANDKLKEVQFAGAQQQRSPLEQQLANIQEEARKAALEAGRAFAATFEGEELTSQQAQELANGLQQIADKYKLIAQEQTNNLTASRTWEQGWKTAFDNYMDNATNAAQQAGQVFSSITRNMESAIDNFVETGKFSFKDFTRSIIQDLIKIELKAQATQLLKAIGGSGGILSSIGSLFGFANGGTPPINKPSLVGENGPELFVPRSAGTVVPGKEVNLGGGAVSAPITNNYITNNISAVDAKSVAQLFAENRKTLLGTVEMARKELPYNNR